MLAPVHATRCRAANWRPLPRPALAVAAALALLLLRAVAATPQPANPGVAPLRIWIDEFFFAEGETALLREAAAASGGVAVVAGATHNRVLQLKSYQQASVVDVMWTGQQGCYEAFRRSLNASHAVSCVPGAQAVTGKANLAASMAAAYGERAWAVLPRSFALPAQYGALAARIRAEQRSGHEGLWVLKEDVHRGRGVEVVAPAEALARALDRTPDGAPRHVLAQRFVGEQLLVEGRPFYIRVWVLLLGADPARAYLWDGGVVVFGRRQRAGQPPDALVVNLWTQDRATAAPWSLQQLLAHLAAAGGGGGAAGAALLRARLHAALSASLAAALPAVRGAAARLPGFQGGSFEVLGADFLVDAALRPWLVEVNQLPSLARKVVACAPGDSGGAAGCERDVPFDEQKERFVAALLRLLTERHRTHAALARQAEQLMRAASDAAGEEQPAPCVGMEHLRQLLAARAEQAAAERLGFVALTARMYGALACAAAGPSSGAGASCGVLADLAPPPPPARQQCGAPTSAGVWLLAWLRSWGDRLRLEATAALAWVRHPAARQRAARQAAGGVPYPLRPSDQHLLAWMQRGWPPIDSVQALHQYCGAPAAPEPAATR